jgi:hypothetical protein
MKKITSDLLAKLGACEGELTVFKKRYPNGIVPTRDLCIELASQFDNSFAVSKLLSPEQRAVYVQHVGNSTDPIVTGGAFYIAYSHHSTVFHDLYRRIARKGVYADQAPTNPDNPKA